MGELDFNANFETVAKRLVDERERRKELVERALSFHVSFLDDCCRAILPHDLILIGARTGAGKTTLASIIAQANALEGKRVHYFALEAEPLEVERWLKYRWLARRAYEERVDRGADLNYPNWYLERCDYTDAYDEEVTSLVAKHFGTLTTYYRGGEFSLIDIERLFLMIQDQTDLIVLDHLHYVDTDDPNENRALKAIAKAIRNMSILIGIPIIVVAHLRKRESRKLLVPDLEDFHGSSDITKIATRAILLAPALNVEPKESHLRSTYVTVAKDRLGGATNTVALLDFNLSTGLYEKEYALGRMDLSGEHWTRIAEDHLPRWARRAV